MRAAVRRAVQALIEGIDMVTLLAGATTSAWAGYTYYPVALDTALRLPAAGAAALAGAFTLSTAVDMVLAPARRRLAQADIAEARSAAESRGAAAVPGSLNEALNQVTAAVEEDAARRAAQAAYHLDLSSHLLVNPGRWRGYPNGEASFYLAPAVVLHYSGDEDEHGIPHHRYTLLTSDDPTPVPITNVRQILEDLAPRARTTTDAAGAAAPSPA
ncbi:hypothetical protein ACFQ7J_27320 [Streptomyces sp. NPDC056501]|uniref:hypothetical protein n=1 Tax=Streptomyces sp. NPDC056501 TaxID=3345841 RepID=UPI0036B010B3